MCYANEGGPLDTQVENFEFNANQWLRNPTKKMSRLDDKIRRKLYHVMFCNAMIAIHHQAAQFNQCIIVVVSTSITAGSTVTKASSLTKTKAFSLKAMLVLLVSQPGACPGLQTPSPSHTPTRPSAPDA